MNNLSGAEPRISHDLPIMAADALAPCIARPSAAIVLNLYNIQVLVFHEDLCHYKVEQSQKIQIHFSVFSQTFRTLRVKISNTYSGVKELI